MAHEITVRGDGRAEAFFGNNTPAWHNLGTVVAGTLSSDKAIEAAGLGWAGKSVRNPSMMPIKRQLTASCGRIAKILVRPLGS